MYVFVISIHHTHYYFFLLWLRSYRFPFGYSINDSSTRVVTDSLLVTQSSIPELERDLEVHFFCHENNDDPAKDIASMERPLGKHVYP